MAFFVEVSMVNRDGERFDYEYGPDGSIVGRFRLAMDEGWIRPLDADGSPLPDTFYDLNNRSQQRGSMSEERWVDFVEAATGVVRQVRSTGAAPETAHRYFG